MIRALLIAAWAAAVSVGASTATAYFRHERATVAHKDDDKHAIEQRKTRIINVPIIIDGNVQGYVLAQFLYTADSAALKALPAPPDAYILDEAFRMIYAEEKVDFRKLQKSDLGKLATDLRARVAERMKSDAVREILLGDFNYVSKQDVRR